MNSAQYDKRTWLRRMALALVASSTLLGVNSLQAQVNIANAPLFLTSSVDPNIMFILDDSGSMMWETLPDELTFRFNNGTAVSWMKWVFPRISNLHGGGDYVTNAANARTVRFSGNLAAQARSSSVNRMYYNPAVTYRPWVNANGSEMDPADPVAALHRPLFPALGTRNLTVDNTWTGVWWNDDGGTTNQAQTFFPAVYYFFNGGDQTLEASYTRVEIRPGNAPFNGHGRENRTDCANASATVPSCTYEEEIQNFANWYTYHRNRVFASRAGISRAFARFDGGMRVGYATINAGGTVDNVAGRAVVRGVRDFTGSSKDEFFDLLFTRAIPTTGTPLRRALEGAGEYFSRTDIRGPWSATPGVATTGETASQHLTCRASFSILMTDGYTTGNQGTDTAWQAQNAARRANNDGSTAQNTTNVHPTNPALNFSYTPIDPFRDDRANTLADVAMYYWKRDLRPDLLNRVPTSDRNPAFWQHMVTYGVGLGVIGTLNPADVWAAVENGEPINWPDPEFNFNNCGDSPGARACGPRIDDLLHAAVNGRGGFFSVDNADDFARELSEVLDDIVSRVETSGTAAATSSAVLQTDTLLYTASFRSTDWSGTVVAREINQQTGVASAIKWDAERIMGGATPPSRNIFTMKPDGTSIALTWTALGAGAQQNALNVNPTGAPATAANGEARINWLRGFENAGLRSRAFDGFDNGGQPLTIIRRIGSIINSDPQFMFRRDYGYSLLPGIQGSSYNAFRNTVVYRGDSGNPAATPPIPATPGRPDVLFVGSNGGMLHAFHAGTPFVNKTIANPAGVIDPDAGKELFAYVPSELLLPRAGTAQTHAQINELMVPGYTHRFFVDGTPAVGDVYLQGANPGWRSVVVGSMGAGGRTVFALDVTDPKNFNASNVLWEFGYADVACVPGVKACREMGFGITQPSIARLRSGQWVAIFGNGFNSASNRAHLFVVDMTTGELLHAIDTGEGSLASPNGLSAPEGIDWPNRDLSLTRAYAGDLQGNLWRFDFSAITTAAPNAVPSVARLFTATSPSPSGSRQPITAKPSIAAKPGDPDGIVVVFGTGSFFRQGDNNPTSPQVQTLYGVFDGKIAVSNVVRTNLRAQTITTNPTAITLASGASFGAGQLRFVSENALVSGDRGWRIDLPVSGERVISSATFPSGSIQRRVRFTTLIPTNDPCGGGRSGFIMDVNLLSGARPTTSVFDVSGDGRFSTEDVIPGLGVVSGLLGTSGERLTAIRRADASVDFLYAGDGTKAASGLNEAGPVGRKSWRQLR